MDQEQKQETVVNVPDSAPAANTKTLAEIDVLKSIIAKWKSAVNEIEELSILKQFADQLAKINMMIKSIP
jgi:hypothetical protein